MGNRSEDSEWGEPWEGRPGSAVQNDAAHAAQSSSARVEGALEASKTVSIGQARANLAAAGVVLIMLPDWLLEVIVAGHSSFTAAEETYVERVQGKDCASSFEQVLFQHGLVKMTRFSEIQNRFVEWVRAFAPDLSWEEANALVKLPFSLIEWGASESYPYIAKLPKDWQVRLGDLGLRIYTEVALGKLK